MKFFDELSEKLKDNIVKWLIFRNKEDNKIEINSTISRTEFQSLCKIIYRCIPGEYEQAFSSIDFDRTSFWRQTSNQPIRKICSGASALLIDTLTNITISDFESITIENEELQNLWEQIDSQNDLKNELYNILRWLLVEGDGAIKISFSNNFKYPTFHFYEGLDVDFNYIGNKCNQIIFKDYYKVKDERYILMSSYSPGKISYKLFDSNKKEVPLSTIEELKGLKDITFLNEDGEVNEDIMLAIPCKIKDSTLWKDRGESILNGSRIQADDMASEAISQLVIASRQTIPKTYIPSTLLGKDENGSYLGMNDYINQFIKMDTSMVRNEEAKLTIQTIETQLQVEKYREMFRQAMILLCQGVISPYTIGIPQDLNNGQMTATEVESHEKETAYTVATIVDKLQMIIKDLVKNTLKSYYLINNNQILLDEDLDVAVAFGQYQSPSFSKRLSLLSQYAAPGRQLMSYKMLVNSLYDKGELTEEEIEEEIQALEKLNNFETLEVNDLFTENVDAEEQIEDIEETEEEV